MMYSLSNLDSRKRVVARVARQQARNKLVLQLSKSNQSHSHMGNHAAKNSKKDVQIPTMDEVKAKKDASPSLGQASQWKA
jgi:hypothetical protein